MGRKHRRCKGGIHTVGDHCTGSACFDGAPTLPKGNGSQTQSSRPTALMNLQSLAENAVRGLRTAPTRSLTRRLFQTLLSLSPTELIEKPRRVCVLIRYHEPGWAEMTTATSGSTVARPCSPHLYDSRTIHN